MYLLVHNFKYVHNCSYIVNHKQSLIWPTSLDNLRNDASLVCYRQPHNEALSICVSNHKSFNLLISEGENWSSALAASSSLHLLEPTGFTLLLKKSLLPNDTRLPK